VAVYTGVDLVACIGHVSRHARPCAIIPPSCCNVIIISTRRRLTTTSSSSSSRRGRRSTPAGCQPPRLLDAQVHHAVYSIRGRRQGVKWGSWDPPHQSSLIEKLEYLAVYGRALAPLYKSYTGLEVRVESRSASHRASRLGHVDANDGL